MPPETDRARTLKGLYHARKRILIDAPDSDSDVVDEEMGLNLEMTSTILSRRQLKRPSTYRNKGYDADVAFQAWLTDARFRTFTHMDRGSVDVVYNLIRDDPVFTNPNPQSPSQQRSVYFQLFVALSRLASDGDGWCIDKGSEVFNIGHGTVLLYTERACLAINKHVERFVRWPNAAARRALSALGEQKYGFPGFVASCDGTMIGLRRAPVFHMFPETYHHHRHGGYGFNTLFWVDHHGSIIRFTCNWPASASDQTIFDDSSFAQTPWKFLKKHEEYIFVDLGFKKEVFAVSPYKGKEAKQEHNALFNFAQRKGRVKVEHANGVIKARFSSLRRMPIQIRFGTATAITAAAAAASLTPQTRSADDMPRCASWITTCIILHNLLLILRDEFEFADVEEEDDDGIVDNQPTPQGKVFNDAVRDRWLRDVQGWT